MSSRTNASSPSSPTLPLRIGAALLAGIGVLGIAQAVVRQALVNAWTDAGAPAAAASSMPASAETGLALAQQRAAVKDWQGAHDHAAAALALSPIDVRLVRTLGLTAEEQKSPNAAQWLALGGQLGWRDTPMQLWQIGKAAEFGDLDNLVLRADGLLRRDDAKDTVLPLLRNAANLPRGAQLIAERLAAKPDWRPFYFMDFTNFSPDQMAGHEAVLSALAKTELPPTRSELGTYLRTLIGMDEPLRAHRVWSRLKGGAQSGKSSVFDGGFAAAREHPPENVIPFEWSLQNGAGAGATVDSAGGNAVLVARTDGSALSPVASQFLVLSPGAYRISTSLLSPAASVDQIGFAWSLRCIPGGHPLYPDIAPRLEQSGAAPSWSFAFAVPSGCPAQQLELRSTRLSPPVSTEARIDNVRIDRIG